MRMSFARRSTRKRTTPCRLSYQQPCPYADLGCNYVGNCSFRHAGQCRFKPSAIEQTQPIVTFDPSNQGAMFEPTGEGNDRVTLLMGENAFQQHLETRESPAFDRYRRFTLPPKAQCEETLEFDYCGEDEDGGEETEGIVTGETSTLLEEGDTCETPMMTNTNDQEDFSQFDPNAALGDWSNDGMRATLQYSKQLAFQSHILSTLSSFRGVPLEVYDRIMEVIFLHVIEGNMEFNRKYFSTTRKAILKTLTEAHGMTGFKSKLVSVKQSHGGSVGVIKFDLVSIFQHMLNDKRLMKSENIAKGYNIWTGKGTSSNTYGEIHEGEKWDEAWQLHMADNPTGTKFALSVVIFYDETHTVNDESLQVAPILAHFTWWNLETRSKTYVNMPIGFIPNLKYGLSKYHKKQTGHGLQDEHDCLYAVFEEMIDISNRGGVEMTVMGREVIGVPWVHYVITDMKGANRLIAGYNDNSGRSSRVNRHCKCGNLKSLDFNCEWVTVEEINESKQEARDLEIKLDSEEHRIFFKDISRHLVDTVGDRGLPMSDYKHGLNLLTPPEVLHVAGVGISVYIVESVNDSVDNQSALELDKLHAELYYDMKRNSDRNYWESGLSKGATSTTKQGATQNIGDVLALVCLSFTFSGRIIFDRRQVSVSGPDKMLPLIMFLTSLQWFHTSNPKEEVINAREFIRSIIRDVITCFPRTIGNGWKIPKVHSYIQMVEFLKMFGNGLNFYGGFGERGHITHVKDNAEQTRQQSQTFLQEIGKRVSEKAVIGVMEESLIAQLSDDIACMSTKNILRRRKDEMDRVSELIVTTQDHVFSPTVYSRSSKCHRGEYSITIEINSSLDTASLLSQDESSCWFDRSIEWTYRNKEKNDAGRTVPYEVQLFFAKLALSSKIRSAKFRCYTETSVKFCDVPNSTIIRCTDDYNGSPWYDFVTIKVDNSEIPCKVLAIVDVFREVRLLVHTQEIPNREYSFTKVLQDEFITRFSLGGFNCIRLVSVSELVSPLIVYPNYGMNTKVDFCALLPKRKWSKFFTHSKNGLRNSHLWMGMTVDE